MKRGFIKNDIFLIVTVLFIVAAVTFYFLDDQLVRVGYAVADCNDVDGDGFYDENCTLVDMGCADETSIISDSSIQEAIDADNGYVVYKKDDSVYLYESSLGESLLGYGINPRISYPYVVWQSLVSDVWQIYVYDISTGTTTEVTSGNSHKISPDVDSEKIVWSDNVNGDWDIYQYDIASGVQSVLIDGTGNQFSPNVYGSYLVYLDDSSGVNVVYLYDSVASVGISSGGDSALDISSNYVVWQNYENNIYSVNVYFLSSGETVSLDTGRLPKINDDYIIWMKESGDNYDLYYFDFETGEDYKLADNVLMPTLDGDNVYFVRSGIFIKSINTACDTVSLDDCNDNDASINSDAVEVCDEVDNDCDGTVDENCANITTNVSTGCLSDSECSAGYTCSSGACVESLDCVAEWDCSNVEWSNCENGISTRDLSLCSVVPSNDECYADEYLPSSEETCISDTPVSQAASTTEDVPVFTWLNLFFVAFILVGYYWYRK